MNTQPLHLHSGIRIVAGRILTTPMLCTRAGRVVASFPAFLSPRGMVTVEAARAYYANGRTAVEKNNIAA